VSIAYPNQKNQISRSSVKETFSGKNITKFGGAGLLRRHFEKIGLWERLEGALPYKIRSHREFCISEMVTSLIYGLTLGFHRPSHMRELAVDTVFQRLAGLRAFPVQSTISRFLGRVPQALTEQLHGVDLNLLLSVRQGFRAFSRLTLDLDSHVSVVYGSQQRAKRGYNPKKPGRGSYHPLVGFIGETRDYLGGVYRPGNRHTSYKALEFLKKMLALVPEDVRGKITRLRADSGFFSYRLMRWLIKKGIEYFIVLPMQPWVQKEIQRLSFQPVSRDISVAEFELILQKPFEPKRLKGRARKKIACRAVVIRTKLKVREKPSKQLMLLDSTESRYDYQVIATNSDLTPLIVWRTYNQRACCENFIKEGIYSYGLDCIPSHTWAGNCLWFELVMLSYNLMNWFKEVALPAKRRDGRPWKRMGSTVRHVLLLVPGKLVNISGHLKLRLERSWYYRREFEGALAQLV
jgi:hypothetical protein